MIEGNVLVLGRDINTDLISSAKYISGGGPGEGQLRYTLYDYDQTFGLECTPGTILVTGQNFGCGSTREIAATVFRDLKIPVILADSFARPFYRNAINIGLLVFEVPNVSKMFEKHQWARIEQETGIVTNLDTGASVTIPPIAPEIQEIIDMGGLIPYVEKKLASRVR